MAVRTSAPPAPRQGGPPAAATRLRCPKRRLKEVSASISDRTAPQKPVGPPFLGLPLQRPSPRPTPPQPPARAGRPRPAAGDKDITPRQAPPTGRSDLTGPVRAPPPVTPAARAVVSPPRVAPRELPPPPEDQEPRLTGATQRPPRRLRLKQTPRPAPRKVTPRLTRQLLAARAGHKPLVHPPPPDDDKTPAPHAGGGIARPLRHVRRDKRHTQRAGALRPQRAATVRLQRTTPLLMPRGAPTLFPGAGATPPARPDTLALVIAPLPGEPPPPAAGLAAPPLGPLPPMRDS